MCELPLNESLVIKTPEGPLQTTQTIAISLGCSPKLGKALLLKVLDAGPREIKLELIWNLPPYWLEFISLKGTMQDDGWKKPAMFLLSCGSCIVQYGPIRQDMATGVLVPCPLWGKPNCFLIGVKVCSRGGNSCLVLQTWLKAHGSGGHRPQLLIYYNRFTEWPCCQNVF